MGCILNFEIVDERIFTLLVLAKRSNNDSLASGIERSFGINPGGDLSLHIE